MKKLTALVLLFAVVFTAFALCSCGDKDKEKLQAEEQEKVDYTVKLNDDVFTYEVLTTDSVAIVGFEGDHIPHAVTIPDKVGERNVVRIAENAFYYQNNVTAVVMPDTITSVGALAFAGCSKLTSVTWSKNLSVIEMGAFEGTGLSALSMNGVAVTEIGNQAFRNCAALASVTLPASIRTLGEGSFESCTAIASLTLPQGLETIGGLCFHNCSALASLELPASVAFIGDYAFNGTALSEENVKTASEAAAAFFADESKFFN